MVVTHREFVTDVLSTSVPGSALVIPVNPGDTKCTPWLSRIASNYERYRIRSMSFHYKPTVGTITQGSVMMMLDYDPADPEPQTKAEMLQGLNATRVSIWDNCTMPVSRRELTSRGELYVRTENRSLITTTLKQFDLGTLFVALANSDPNLVGVVGELHVSYTVELSVPQASSTTTPSVNRNLGESDIFHPVRDPDQPHTVANDSTMEIVVQHDPNVLYEGIEFPEPFAGFVDLEYDPNDFTSPEDALQNFIFGNANGEIELPVTIGSALSMVRDAVTGALKYTIPVLAQAGETLLVGVEAGLSGFGEGSTIWRFLPATVGALGTLLTGEEATEALELAKTPAGRRILNGPEIKEHLQRIIRDRKAAKRTQATLELEEV